MSHKLVVVVGATGNQGSGVVEALLSESPQFKVRAVTTNPESTRAKKLLDKYSEQAKQGRFELVKANLNDKASLERALEGSYGLFASFGPGATPKNGEEGEEVKQGKNLVDAAKVGEIQHFVYSSLSGVKEQSQGKLSEIHHHESKVAVERYAKEHLPSVTTVLPAAFFSNLAGRGWSSRKTDDGTAVFCAPFGHNVRLAWTDDQKDVGTFARAIFEKGSDAMKGKSFVCASAPTSIQEVANDYAKLTGEKVVVEPLSVKEGAYLTAQDMGIDESVAKELEDVFGWYNQIYENLPREALDEMNNGIYEELGHGVRASTFEKFLARSGWRVKE